MDNAANRTALIIAAGITLGVIGDLLFQDCGDVGINVSLWVAAWLVVGCVVLTRLTVHPMGDGFWFAAPAALFALCLAWRDSGTLRTLDLSAITVSGSICAAYGMAGRARSTGAGGYLLALLVGAVNMAGGGVSVLRAATRRDGAPRKAASRNTLAVIRGLLIAFPLLLLFGSLFASADAVFAQMVGKLFDWDTAALFRRLAWTTMISWTAAGFLDYALGRDGAPAPAVGQDAASCGPLTGSSTKAQAPASPLSGCFLGRIETAITLGLLDLLFLSFILVEIRYLFGGAALVRETVHMTYAEYARAGFFELATASGLLLPVLLLLHWACDRRDAVVVGLFQRLASVQILLLFVVMASAIYRMHIYQEAFGLTELRIYTVAFMGWLALVFLWMSVTVLRERAALFTFGSLAAGLAVVFCLHCINPDALIVRVNVAKSRQTGRFDACYASSLSDDAVPALAEAYPSLSPRDRSIVAWRLLQSAPPANIDWRSWTLDTALAWDAVQAHDVELHRDHPIHTPDPCNCDQ